MIRLKLYSSYLLLQFIQLKYNIKGSLLHKILLPLARYDFIDPLKILNFI